MVHRCSSLMFLAMVQYNGRTVSQARGCSSLMFLAMVQLKLIGGKQHGSCSSLMFLAMVQWKAVIMFPDVSCSSLMFLAMVQYVPLKTLQYEAAGLFSFSKITNLQDSNRIFTIVFIKFLFQISTKNAHRSVLFFCNSQYSNRTTTRNG